MSTLPVGPLLSQLICQAYRADQPVLLQGGTGIGKSETFHQVGEALSEKYGEQVSVLVRDLSIMEAPDLAGMPHLEDGTLHYAPPAFLPRSGRGLLVFEELNRAPRHVQAPCLQLLTDRCLNDYVLPPGWLPVAAINPSDDGAYSGTADLDTALLARFMRIDVVADKRSWLKWAETNGVHHAVCRYVRECPDPFGNIWANPRAWTAASRFLSSRDHAGLPPQEIIQPALVGLLGEEIGSAFCGYLLRQDDTACELPQAAALLHAYGKHRKQIQKIVNAGDSAQLNALTCLILGHLQDPDEEEHVRQSKRKVKALGRLLKDLPAEFRRMIVESHHWLDGDA